jgi:hypothetical protein
MWQVINLKLNIIPILVPKQRLHRIGQGHNSDWHNNKREFVLKKFISFDFPREPICLSPALSHSLSIYIYTFAAHLSDFILFIFTGLLSVLLYVYESPASMTHLIGNKVCVCELLIGINLSNYTLEQSPIICLICFVHQ